jgi:hypothetical protein
MQVWVLVLILATIVFAVGAGALVVIGANARIVAQSCGCTSQRSRLTDSSLAGCFTKAVYPMVMYGDESVLEDAFPTDMTPFVIYMPSLDQAALTAVVKAKYPRFEPLLTSSGWTVTCCYVKQAAAGTQDSATGSARGTTTQVIDNTLAIPVSSRTPTVNFEPTVTSVVLRVLDADEVPRVVLMSVTEYSQSADVDAYVWALFTTDSATESVDAYKGTWTHRAPDGQDDKPGGFSVLWPRPDTQA